MKKTYELKLCACGCGQTFMPHHGRQKLLNPKHRDWRKNKKPTGTNENARELAKLRLVKLTPRKRTAIARNAAYVRWSRAKYGIAY